MYKVANKALDKIEKERRKEWYTHDIESLIENNKREYNKCFLTKNAEDRERYKKVNRIVKEREKK